MAEIDLAHVLHPISPYIYGLAECEPSLRPGLCRWGGNAVTRYNWELGSASNAASDWEFRNISYSQSPEALRTPSGSADRAIAAAQQQGAAFLLTVPALGWVARDGSTETRSTDVPAAGGPAIGSAADGGQDHQGAIAGYDPSANRLRTSLPSFARKRAPFQFPPNRDDEAVFQDEWIAHLVERFGRAAEGGVRFYAIDNEPDLWSHTHRDVHPAHMGYDSMLATFLDYATAIKDVDPTAEIVGPVVSGWTGLFFSTLDRGANNFATAPDRRAHDGMPFVPWFLQAVRAHDEQVGRRSLDVLAVHWYPQGGEYGAGKSDPGTDARRLRATRQLWDPTYRDESWIVRTRDAGSSGAVRLIPRLRDWIDQYYPGTKLAITEWNYGADETLNGALAIAEVLGVFGRERVDLAAYWRSPKPGSPGALAFQLYRNYDGQGGQFGDLALPVERRDRATREVSVFASRQSETGDLVVILINKDADRMVPVQLRIAGHAALAEQAQLYRYGPATTQAIERAPDVYVVQGQIELDLPASSIALLRVPVRTG